MIRIALAGAVLLAPGASSAQPQPLANAVQTIFLDPGGHVFTRASPVVYHPAFDRYYGSDESSTNGPGFVFSSTGGMALQTLMPLNIDTRSWTFNPDNGLLEVVTYNAVAGGAARGLLEAKVDGAGLLTGLTATLLPSMPGLAGAQTAPGRDTATGLFYSRSTTNTVNVVRRSNGTLAGTVVLDFTAASLPAATEQGIVFVPEPEWLVVLDSATARAVVFDRLGKFVGSSALDFVPSGFASATPGYTNGQLFVFDTFRQGWQGYRIFDHACDDDAECDDGNACTDDACTASFQCTHADNTAPCSDGNSCSSNDACTQGACAASVAGFEGLACVMHRLKARGLCADVIPAKLRRFILKRVAQAQAAADQAETQGGNAGLLARARIALDSISAKADKAVASSLPSKQISPTCAAAIRTQVQEVAALLNTLS